ncbi:MAG: histidine kinase, partial [Chloroflexota bacterium]
MNSLDQVLSPDSWILIIITAIIALIVGALLTLLVTGSKPKEKPQPRPTPTQRPAAPKIPKSKFIDIEQLRRIYRILADLSTTLNYHRVLDKALSMSIQSLTTDQGKTDSLAGAVLLFSQSEVDDAGLFIETSLGFSPADLNHTFPAEDGLLKKTIDAGSPILVANVAKDPELNRSFTIQNCKSAYCLPLSQGINSYGVMLFAHPEEKFFNPVYRETLNIITKQAVIAIQNAQLYQDLAQEKERMMEIQEEARNKLARDLHDGPTQNVASIAMRVNFARRLVERDLGAATEELYRIEDLARKTTKEIRHMLFTLRPLVLESQGLGAALMSMAEKMQETYNQKVLLDIDDVVVDDLEKDKQGVLFYIVEEAVNNARKHAQADHIWVRLNLLRKELALLEIQDDGLGYDHKTMMQTYEQRGSLGMINLRERTELVSG